MNEENIGVFNARYMVNNELDTLKPCTVFLTRNRIIVVSRGGINPWTAVTVIAALATSFTGLLLRNYALFLIGLGAAIIAGLCIAIIDLLIRYKEARKIKRLNPQRILEMTEKNLEIQYETIAKVIIRTFNRYPGRSDFMPSFTFLQEHQYVIEFATNDRKHTFILDGNKLYEFIDLIREFIPKTTEIEKTEM